MLGSRSFGALSLSFAIGVWLFGCEPRRRTEVLVVIDAEPSVSEDATTLHLRVEGGDEVLMERLDQTLGSSSMPVQLPTTLAIVPLGRDPRRRFRVEATAFDRAGAAIGTVRALSSFLEGRTLVLRLVLDEACRGARCPETCRAGTCVPESVDPDTLPDLDGAADAGASLPDAFARGDDSGTDAALPRDAASPIDAWASVDAASGADSSEPDATVPTDVFVGTDVGHFGGGDLCGPDCLTLPLPSGIGRGITFNTGDVWARPEAGVCPVPLAAGTYSWAAQRLYNSSTSAVSVQLDTSRSDPDTMLVVYREPLPVLGTFPAPPADPTDCLLAIDDTPAVSPHVRTSVIVPALEAIVVLVTTAAPDTLGHAQLDVQ